MNKQQTNHTQNNNKKERIIPGRKYKPNATEKEEKWNPPPDKISVIIFSYLFFHCK